MRQIVLTLTAVAALVGAGISAPAPASAQAVDTGPFGVVAAVITAPFAAATFLGETVMDVPVSGVYPGYRGDQPVGTSYGGNPLPSFGAAAPNHGVLPNDGMVRAYEATATACYFTKRRIRGAWHRVQLCD